MSSVQVVNQGETAWLTLITDVDMTLRLYQNDVTSGLTDVQVEALTEGSFTEATFTGYAASSLTTAWTVTAGNPSTATRSAVTFTRSSTGTAQLIYGYYLTRNSDGALQYFEHFDGPVSVEDNGDAVVVTPTLTLDDEEGNAVEAGHIAMTGRSTAPTGWLLCDGAAVSRTTYAALFAAIGTAYGAGNGTTTFNVPNLQQRFPLGKATSGTGTTLGSTGGAIDHVHDLNSSSSHAQITSAGSSTDNPFMSRKAGVTGWTANIQTDTNVSAQASTTAQTSGVALAGDTDVENPPFQVVNFMVKT